MSLEILAETNEWFVLNKPAPLHTVNLKSSLQSLESQIRQQRPDQNHLPEAGIVHRLDYETTGCVLVAKNERSRSSLINKLRDEGFIQKFYLALVTEPPSAKGFDLYFSSRYRGSKKVTAKSVGKKSERGRASIRVILSENNLSVLEVNLIGPGQRHQIRAGLASLKSPLFGDELYRGKPWSGGLGLHAYKLVIEEKVVIAPVPSLWQKHLPAHVLEALRDKLHLQIASD